MQESNRISTLEREVAELKEKFINLEKKKLGRIGSAGLEKENEAITYNFDEGCKFSGIIFLDHQ